MRKIWRNHSRRPRAIDQNVERAVILVLKIEVLVMENKLALLKKIDPQNNESRFDYNVK